MTITIGKHFEFEASHLLPGKIYGKCQNLHGHTYKLEVVVSGKMNDELGWIDNFSVVKEIVKTQIIDEFDHSHLNKFLPIPTAENILLLIASILSKSLHETVFTLHRLKLYETSNSFAEIIF